MKNFHNWAYNLWIAYVVFLFFQLFSSFSTIITYPFKYLTIVLYFHIVEKLTQKGYISRQRESDDKSRVGFQSVLEMHFE